MAAISANQILVSCPTLHGKRHQFTVYGFKGDGQELKQRSTRAASVVAPKMLSCQRSSCAIIGLLSCDTSFPGACEYSAVTVRCLDLAGRESRQL